MTESQHSQSDTEMFGTVLELIAYKVSINERMILAERIKASQKGPLNLIRRLAADEIIVARPVLQYSSALTDEDLTTLSPELSQDHLLAIALRQLLPASVTDVLIKHGNELVLGALLQNMGVEFSAGGKSQLRARAKTNAQLSQLIDLRPDFRPHFVVRLWKRIVKLFKALFFIVDDDEAILAEGSTGESDVPETFEPGDTDHPDGAPGSTGGFMDSHLDGSGDDKSENRSAQFMLAEEKLIENARAGLVAETVSGLAEITESDEEMAEHCLFKSKPSALVVLCKAYRISSSVLLSLLDIRTSVTGDKSVRTVSLLRSYESMPVEKAKHIFDTSDDFKIGNDVTDPD